MWRGKGWVWGGKVFWVAVVYSQTVAGLSSVPANFIHGRAEVSKITKNTGMYLKMNQGEIW